MSRKLTAKQKERKFIVECIQLYRDLPILWNVKSKEYHDREKKNNAYELLLGKYKEMFPEATKADVKKKFNALRTNYRKELKKHLQLLKSGFSSNDIQEPKLWYFDEMSFLRDQKCTSDTQPSMTVKIEEIDTESLTIDDNIVHGESTTAINTQSPSTSYEVPIIKATKSEKKDEESEIPCKRLTKPDEYQNWSLDCAAELQKMDPTQQIYAKKAIAEIIMEGRLGLLHRHSVKINDSSYITHYSNPSSLPSTQYSSTPSP